MTRKEFIEKNLRPKERKRFYAMLKTFVEAQFSNEARRRVWIETYLNAKYDRSVALIGTDLRILVGSHAHKKWNETYLSRIKSVIEKKTNTL